MTYMILNTLKMEKLNSNLEVFKFKKLLNLPISAFIE